MDWIVVQLSEWAKTKLKSEEIRRIVHHRLKTDILHVFYPILEDDYGKQDAGFGEYVFITYEPKIDYSPLNYCDEFTGIMRTRSGSYEMVSSPQVAKIQEKIQEARCLYPGDVVKIMEGPLEKSFGVVVSADEGEVTVEIQNGNEKLSASFPAHHLRKNRRKTQARRKKKDSGLPAMFVSKDVNHQSNSWVLPASPVVGNFLPRNSTNLGQKKISKIVRRGLKNTRVIINGESVLIDNQELKNFLVPSSEEENKSER